MLDKFLKLLLYFGTDFVDVSATAAAFFLFTARCSHSKHVVL